MVRRFFNSGRPWIRTVGLAALVAGGAFPFGPSPPGRTLRPDLPEREEIQRYRLRQVSGEIERLRAHLAEEEREEGNILSHLDRLDLEARLLEVELEELGGRIRETRGTLERTRGEAAACRLRVEEEKRALGAWLRGMYTRGPAPYLALLLGARDADQLLHAYRYASFLTRAEAERLERFRRALAELREVEQRLAVEEGALRRLQEEREERARSLARARRRKAEELTEIRLRADLLSRLMTDLSRTEAELRDLVGRLDRGEREVLPPGPGIRGFKGILDWPAEGKVAVPFGEQLHPRFGTVTPHPGVAIFVPEGREIRAVFDGTVVFADWFRGYGNMVILDHGGGYLSIYAHASRLLVRESQEVLQGDVIALTGATGSLDGPQLYFEIRERGAPVDPLAWLRRP